MEAILEGIKVLDLTRLLPGPFCTQMLGDMGAEVIKIEEPGQGDYIRIYPPQGKTEGALYLSVNRNKKSLSLDIKSPEGREVILKLIPRVDVVVEQFRPGYLQTLGLGWDDLQAVNPRLIMCSISGYGQSGPCRDQAGHDINYLSQAGILDHFGAYQAAPVVPGIQVADVGGGSLWAALGIVAALLAREKGAGGQYLDISMLDTVFTYTVLQAGAYFFDRKVPRRGEGLINGGYAWYNVYPTRDGRFIALGMLEAKFWQQFCKAIGQEDFIKKQFAPRPVQEEMIRKLRELFSSRDASEWLNLLEPLDICASLVNNLEEAINDPHLREREMIIKLEHPLEGTIQAIGFPLRFSNSASAPRTPPPVLGQHTGEILRDLGYSAPEIEALRHKKII